MTFGLLVLSRPNWISLKRRSRNDRDTFDGARPRADAAPNVSSLRGTPGSPFADLRTMRNAVWLEPRLRPRSPIENIIDSRLRAPSWRGVVRDEDQSIVARSGWERSERDIQ
jgi:hypothetical protein